MLVLSSQTGTHLDPSRGLWIDRVTHVC